MEVTNGIRKSISLRTRLKVRGVIALISRVERWKRDELILIFGYKLVEYDGVLIDGILYLVHGDKLSAVN